MKPRTVFYGHSAHLKEDGFCIVPENTTVTLYAPLGALLDKSIAIALINGEQITAADIELVRADYFFITHDLVMPPHALPKLQLSYPCTYKAGDTVPNFYLNEDVCADFQIKPLNPTPTSAFYVGETTMLKDLLELYKGNDIHWASCSFSKTPDATTIGDGYACKFRSDSPLKAIYAPQLSNADKCKRREERFGPVSTDTNRVGGVGAHRYGLYVPHHNSPTGHYRDHPYERLNPPKHS